MSPSTLRLSIATPPTLAQLHSSLGFKLGYLDIQPTYKLLTLYGLLVELAHEQCLLVVLRRKFSVSLILLEQLFISELQPLAFEVEFVLFRFRLRGLGLGLRNFCACFAVKKPLYKFQTTQATN